MVGGMEGGRMEGAQMCRRCIRRFANAVNLWRTVSGKPGGGWPEPRAARPENGLASQPLIQPGLLWRCQRRSAVCLGLMKDLGVTSLLRLLGKVR